MKLAVLFDNFGPYHVARLNAAATVADVLGVEFASESGEYGWTRHSTPEKFVRRTLFFDGPSRQCSARRLLTRLHEAFAEFAPDAVALPGWSGRLSFAALSWCLRNSVPAIAMSESTADDRARWHWKESIKRRCLGACSTGLVGGERHRDYLVQLGMPANRIFLGYDAVDNGYFSAGAAAARQREAECRAQLGLPRRYFLASARFVEKKNLPGLIRAFASYRTQAAATAADAWDLVVLGDGALRSKLEQLCAGLGLSSHIHLPGFRQYDQLPAYYGLAGALVHASSVEQWGLVVNEAMAAGLPVLVSRRCGCAPTLVREGENGMTFDPDDVDQMAGCMLRVAQLPESERAGMGLASQRVIANFGPERFAAGLAQAAELALSKRTSRHRLGDSLLLGALLAGTR